MKLDNYLYEISIALTYLKHFSTFFIREEESTKKKYFFLDFDFSGTNCSEVRGNRSRMNVACTCLLEVKLQTNLTNEIVIYYKLENFFQNHRR